MLDLWVCDIWFFCGCVQMHTWVRKAVCFTHSVYAHSLAFPISFLWQFLKRSGIISFQYFNSAEKVNTIYFSNSFVITGVIFFFSKTTTSRCTHTNTSFSYWDVYQQRYVLPEKLASQLKFAELAFCIPFILTSWEIGLPLGPNQDFS